MKQAAIVLPCAALWMWANMIIVEEVEENKGTIAANLERLTGQVFRLLPAREEGEDWIKPCETLITETLGLFNLVPELSEGLTVASKLQGLKEQGEDVEFPLYRRTIFECCTLLSKLKMKVQGE